MPEWLKVVFVILVAGFLFVMIRMEALNPAPVDDGTADAGVVVSCVHHPAEESKSEWSEIETDKGKYVVPGKFRTVKGHRLIIKQQVTSGKWLMDEAENFSAPLMSK